LLTDYNTATMAIPAEQALGAVILNAGIFGAARRSANVRTLTTVQAASHIRSEQPASYTEPIVVRSVQPYFYGGTPTRRTNMALRIMNRAARAEAHAATGTLQNLAGEDASLHVVDPVIVLTSASTFIPKEAKGALEAQALEAIGTSTITLAPSPLLVPNA
jgi:hypothetical protein